MSYFQISNGPGTDAARPGDDSGDILESLLAANIPAPAAERIASALQSVYASQSALAASVRAALSGSRPPPQKGIDQQGQEQITADDRGRADRPELSVSGRATIGGDLNVGGDILTNNLRVLNNAGVGRRLSASAAAFRTLQVAGGARIANGVANIDALLVTNRPILARQGGQYAGQNVFNGRVSLNGQVIWNNRVCDPANVVLIKTLAAGGDNKLRIGTGEVRVLRDHGNGPGGALRFEYDANTQQALTAVTANTATTTINNYSLSSTSVNCVTQLQTESVTVLTAVGFDPASCAVTSASTTVYVVSAVSSGAFSAATYSSSPDTPVLITDVTLSRSTANVAALTGNIRITAIP
jgi:hypothetical protein